MPNLRLIHCLLGLYLSATWHGQAPAPVYRNLDELEKQEVLTSLRRVGGTSAGAIQAALLAVRYCP